MSDSSELGEYTASAPGNMQPRAAQNVSSVRATFYSEQGGTGRRKVLAVKKKDYPTFDALQDYLSGALSVPVRCITTPHGKNRVKDIDQLRPGEYVCFSKSKGRGVNLTQRTWNAGNKLPPSRVTYMSDDSGVRDRQGHPMGASRNGSDPGFTERSRRPKKLTMIRNGDSKRRIVFLLNLNTNQRFEEFLADVGASFDCHVGKLFMETGQPVKSLTDIIRGPDCYIVAEGSEKFDRATTRPLKEKKTIAAWGENKKSRTRGKWAVTVQTSDREDAGTTANVSLTVYGQKGCSPTIPLNVSEGELFKSGHIDQFEVSVGNIGKIFKIRLAHDNYGEDPSWLCDEVKLKDVHTQEELNFECRRWISDHDDDLETCRELPATRPGEATLPVLRYNVTSVTGNLWNAYTEANVYITMYGENGDTGVRRLSRDEDARKDKFQKGQTDEFQVEAVKLGKLKRVIIGHDGNGAGQGWFLENLTISEAEGRTSNNYVFACNRWLDEAEEDGKIVRELKLVEDKMADLIEKQSWEYLKWIFEAGNNVRLYSVAATRPIRIKPDATVDADGDYDDPLAACVLMKQSIFKVVARRGNVRVFQSVNHERFHLAIDNAKLLGQGRGGAYCEMRVRVQQDRSIVFESVKFSGQMMRVNATGRVEDPRTGANKLDTNRRFHVYCKGMLRNRGIIMLCTSLSQTLTMDEDSVLIGTGKRNQVSHFRVHKVGDDGNIRMFESVVYPKRFIRMKEGRCDVLGTGDDYCKFKCIRVRDQAYILLESQMNRGIYLGMLKDGTVKPTVETGDVNTRFYPEVIEFGDKKGEEGKEKEDVPVETKARKKRRQVVAPVPLPIEEPQETAREESAQSHFEGGDWKVWINTTETAQNGEVVLVVYGDAGCSGPIILGTAGQNDMFVAGNQDQFKINLGSVGRIYKIRLELCGNEPRKPAYWKVKDAKFKDMTTKETYKFRYNREFGLTRGDVMREKAVVRPKESVLPEVTYKVFVYTGNEAGADTDANVFMTVYGDKGDWGKRQLYRSNNENKFEEGQVDEFEVEAVTLGELQQCVICHDGQDPYEGWLCDKVIIQEGDDPTHEWVFQCGKWLDTGIEDRVIERVLQLEDDLDTRRSQPMAIVKQKTWYQGESQYLTYQNSKIPRRTVPTRSKGGKTRIKDFPERSMQHSNEFSLNLMLQPVQGRKSRIMEIPSIVTPRRPIVAVWLGARGWQNIRDRLPEIIDLLDRDEQIAMNGMAPDILDVHEEQPDWWNKVRDNFIAILNLRPEQSSSNGWEKVQESTLAILAIREEQSSSNAWEKVQESTLAILAISKGGWAKVQNETPAILELYHGGWQKIRDEFSDILDLCEGAWQKVQTQSPAILKMYTGGWMKVQSFSSAILDMYNGGWKRVQLQSSDIFAMYKGGWRKMQTQSSSILEMYHGGWSKTQVHCHDILNMYQGGWKGIQSETNAIIGMYQGGWKGIQSESIGIIDLYQGGWRKVQTQSSGILEMYHGGWKKTQHNNALIVSMFQGGGWQRISRSIPSIIDLGNQKGQ